MPKKLTKLRITSVASVDRGAGEGVEVLLMKRDAAEGALADSLEDIVSSDLSYDQRMEAVCATLKQFGEYLNESSEPYLLAMNLIDEAAEDLASETGISKADARTKVLDLSCGRLLDQAAKYDLNKTVARQSACERLDTSIEVAKGNFMKSDFEKFTDMAEAARLPDETREQAFVRLYDRAPAHVQQIVKAARVATTPAEPEAMPVVKGSAQMDELNRQAEAVSRGEGIPFHRAFQKVYMDPRNHALRNSERAERLNDAANMTKVVGAVTVAPTTPIEVTDAAAVDVNNPTEAVRALKELLVGGFCSVEQLYNSLNGDRAKQVLVDRAVRELNARRGVVGDGSNLDNRFLSVGA